MVNVCAIDVSWPPFAVPPLSLRTTVINATPFASGLNWYCSVPFGIVIVGGSQTIEPTVTNEEESEALGVPLHSPAFLFERTTRADDGEIVEYVRSIYRGDRYRLVTDLSAQPLPHRPALAAAGHNQRDGRDHPS